MEYVSKPFRICKRFRLDVEELNRRLRNWDILKYSRFMMTMQ